MSDLTEASHDVSASPGRPGPRLRTADGIAVATRCWFSEPPGRAMVVIAHGLTANKDDPRLVPLATELHRLGFDVITYDSRGHGQSGGRCTLGALERHDVAAVVDWVRDRCDRIVLVGASMGAVAVLGHAAADPELVGVVTVSSPGGWRLPLRARSVVTAWLARTHAGRSLAQRKMGVRIGPWMSPESARALVKRVGCPVIVVHGRKDPIIPHRSGLARVVARDPQRSVVLVPSMGHAFDPLGYSPICDAVTRLVDGTGSPARSNARVGLTRTTSRRRAPVRGRCR